MAIQPVFDFLNKQDTNTRAFVAKAMTLGMVGSIFLTIGTEAVLALRGMSIPPQISSLLFALVTGQIVGIAHTQGATAAQKSATDTAATVIETVQTPKAQ